MSDPTKPGGDGFHCTIRWHATLFSAPKEAPVARPDIEAIRERAEEREACAKLADAYDLFVRIRARCEAATEGERSDVVAGKVLACADNDTEPAPVVARVERDEDRALVAHARSDIPALLAHVERPICFECGEMKKCGHRDTCELAAILEGRPPPAKSV